MFLMYGHGLDTKKRESGCQENCPEKGNGMPVCVAIPVNQTEDRFAYRDTIILKPGRIL